MRLQPISACDKGKEAFAEKKKAMSSADTGVWPSFCTKRCGGILTLFSKIINIKNFFEKIKGISNNGRMKINV